MKEISEKARPGTAGTDEILTLKQFADYLKCHPSSLYRLIRDGDVPYFRLGGDYRFQKSTIDNWIRNKTRARARG
jgi:excisionase family DNA binding protein